MAKGDYTQASEKLCGAPAEIVRAVAAMRGMRLGAHKSLTKFVAELDEAAFVDHSNPDLLQSYEFRNSQILSLSF